MNVDDKKLLAKFEETIALRPQSSKVLIVGLGATGLSTASFLQRLGINIAITDSRDRPPLMAELRQQMPDVAVFTGGFDASAFAVATHIIVSPGVSIREPLIVKAVNDGAMLISDIDLFALAAEKPVAAITGSNGKSTVTTLLGEMASNAGINVAVGGNLGTPALDLLAAEVEMYVLELSSFQLERTSHLNAAVATVLNVTPDHLDRHSDLASYASEKQRIFRGEGVMVLNADDPMVMAMAEPVRESMTFSVRRHADYWFDETNGLLMHQDDALLSRTDLVLVGIHNLANALAALTMGCALGLDESSMIATLKKFKGLEHRMQKVFEINGVSWINDSKATNTGACIAALENFSKNVILIAGGEAKGADMADLRPVVAGKSKAVILIGKDAPMIEQALQNSVPVYFAANIREAVKLSAELAQPGDSVLLSPACASFDQFKNYIERGNRFVEAVMGMYS